LIRFFNSVEPVTDFFRDLVPALAGAGVRSEIVLSSAEYRPERGRLEDVLDPGAARVYRVPAAVAQPDTRLRKAAGLTSDSLGALARAMTARGGVLNVFLTQLPLFSSAGPCLKAIREQPYCLQIMDLYPHVLAASGGMTPDGVAYRALRGATWAALRDEAVGSVVAPGDVDRLEAAIARMADDRGLCSQMGARSRRLAAGTYGREAAVSRYVHMLSALVEGREPRPAAGS
jgi:glycosyltransferase involved in cell wall biosynthesis